jgi:hypothetical protein
MAMGRGNELKTLGASPVESRCSGDHHRAGSTSETPGFALTKCSEKVWQIHVPFVSQFRKRLPDRSERKHDRISIIDRIVEQIPQQALTGSLAVITSAITGRIVFFKVVANSNRARPFESMKTDLPRTAQEKKIRPASDHANRGSRMVTRHGFHPVNRRGRIAPPACVRIRGRITESYKLVRISIAVTENVSRIRCEIKECRLGESAGEARQHDVIILFTPENRDWRRN